MSSRTNILAAIGQNAPAMQALPGLSTINAIQFDDKAAAFIQTTESIGSRVIAINSFDEIVKIVADDYGSEKSILTTIAALVGIEQVNPSALPRHLSQVDLAIIPARFGVAENGAVWIQDDDFIIRALPFICENLAVVLDKKNMVNNMHEAYENIGAAAYEFGLFIAGPSKTADIEQSLVLGAHGPKTMTIFLME